MNGIDEAMILVLAGLLSEPLDISNADPAGEDARRAVVVMGLAKAGGGQLAITYYGIIAVGAYDLGRKRGEALDAEETAR